MSQMIPKGTAEALPKGYDPKQTEGKWYQFWLDKKYFEAPDTTQKKPFSMVIPPPNVTGSLHMGHALNNTLQDIIARWKRMSGFETLWLPGMDHAGIATQNVVEKQLAKEGIQRRDLGREKFVERVWKWKEESGGMILRQQQKLGNSVDWSRCRFTLDEGLSKAVRKVFVDLYKQGLMYQGNYLVNWCPRCTTAISDLEVVHQESQGSLWHIRYPLEGSTASSGEGVVVATTRPETMLADTAVAVHPEDERYKKFVGHKIKLPLTDRTIPVIADEMVEREFGSGVVKITPAHDFNDYAVAKRHMLPMITLLDERAVVNEHGGAYKGMKVLDARKKVVEDLTEQGYLVKEEKHVNKVGRCQRCETIVEPRLSKQWFVKIQPLADKAIKVVEDGSIRFVPEQYKKNYLDWMYNIQDWCVSRQLWWGHRIPAWHCGTCKKTTVEMTDPTKCAHCGSSDIIQDPDVLDTWFSSALWPFSTLGWPEETPSLKTYYPTSLLVTSFDIIFFWVARMIMMGMHFMHEIPFKDVHIHALVRDERGQKMSKSKGNVVDPLGLIDDYGADALRFTMASLAAQGRDVKFNEDKCETNKNFINKIWNATRFSMMTLEGVSIPDQIDPRGLSLADKWILYRLQQAIKDVEAGLHDYRFSFACEKIYQFVWNEFCDWYVELVKPVLYGQDLRQKETTGHILLKVLDNIVRLLHPFIPFVTEEIYQLLPGHGESACIQKYPSVKDMLFGMADEKAAHEIEIIKEAVTAVRNIRGENRISPALKINARFVAQDKESMRVLTENHGFLMTLARLEKLDVAKDPGNLRNCALSPVAIGDSRVDVVVPLEGLVDIAEERKRVQKEIDKTQKDIDLTSKKLESENFVKNAPGDIVEQERTRLSQLSDRKGKLQDALARLS